MDVNVTSLRSAVDMILEWSYERVGRYVCVSNVHMCMEVFDREEYAKTVNGSDLTVPDGKPVVWAQRAMGYSDAQQVRGTDLTIAICQEAEELGIPVGFYGATDDLLNKLGKTLRGEFPKLMIAYTYAPPYRPITNDEDQAHIDGIKESGIRILFVGLGCPKQEIWMVNHKGQINCVMLGVGAAFDFIAGNKKHAPHWMQKIGLEWLFRFLCEPRRLWKRYLKHNPRFVYHFILQLLKLKISSRKS